MPRLDTERSGCLPEAPVCIVRSDAQAGFALNRRKASTPAIAPAFRTLMNSESLARHQRAHLLLLALIVLLAAVLRFFSLSSLGFWTDEFCTLSCSHGWGLQFDRPPLNQIAPALPPVTKLSAAQPFSQIVPAMVRDEAHPPLYFLLLRLWEDCSGDSEVAVRSLNVAFSLIAIVLLFFTARDSVGATAALWACLLMAVAEPQIQFSQEARNYMPVEAFSLVAIWAVQQLKRKPQKKYAILFGGALVAMMLTHYFAAGVALALGIYVLSSLRKTALKLGVTASVGAALVFSILWGPSLYRQLPHFQSNYSWLADAGPGHPHRVLLTILNLPWRLITELPSTPTLLIAAKIVAAAFYFFLVIAFIRRPALRVWVVWVTCAIGIVVSVDLIRSTAQLGLLRYTLFATPAMYVLVAAAVERGRWRWVLPAAATLLALFSLPSACVPRWKTDFRTPVQIVAKRMLPGDALVISGPDPIADGVMFAAFQHYLPTMSTMTAVLTKAPDRATLAQLQQRSRVWLVRLPASSVDAIPGYEMRPILRVPYVADVMLGQR
jgi:uncharacterized membrane protein